MSKIEENEREKFEELERSIINTGYLGYLVGFDRNYGNILRYNKLGLVRYNKLLDIQVFSKYHDQVLFFYFNLFFKTESKFKKNIKKISFNNQLGPPFFQLLVSFCLTLTKLGFQPNFWVNLTKLF